MVDSLVALALEQRAAARTRKDWAAADAVRDQLKAAGVVVEDTPTRSTMDSRGALTCMPGNSERRGRRAPPRRRAPRSAPAARTGHGLQGRGRTLPADERPWHKGYSGDEELPSRTAWKQEKERRAAAAEGRAPKIGLPGTKSTTRGGAARTGAAMRGASARAGHLHSTAGRPGRKAQAPKEAAELLVGRNPVLEALRTHMPAPRSTSRSASTSTTGSPRSSAPPATGASPMLEVSRAELDRMTGGVLHQGVGLQVPPFAYEPFEDLLAAAREAVAPLLVALDGVTDPRNLGAVVRSAAAFGAQGVFLPERRAAGMTATAWRTSAGAAARLPVAQVTNLTRALQAVPGGRLHRGRASTPTARPASTTWRPRSARWWSWSAPRGAGCPASSARPATCGSASRCCPRWSRSTRPWPPPSPWPRSPGGGGGAQARRSHGPLHPTTGSMLSHRRLRSLTHVA